MVVNAKTPTSMSNGYLSIRILLRQLSRMKMNTKPMAMMSPDSSMLISL
jgi:hypothetical protein